MVIRLLIDTDRRWIRDWITRHFGSARIVSRGVAHNVSELHGLVAEDDGAPVGLLLYQIRDQACEVVALIATFPRRGIGRQLVDALRRLAEETGCPRLWLVTTNENQEAMSFYRAIGWQQVAVHRGAVREARRLKPEIPELAADGTPIEDEIEFELRLDGDLES